MTILCLEVTEATVIVDRSSGTAPDSILRPCEVAAECVRNHRGSVITIIPGLVMAEFQEPVTAVRVAMEVQRQLTGESGSASRSNLELRVGVYSPAKREKGIELKGDSIEATTRISKRAGPGQILISRAVYEAVSQDSDLQCQWVSSFKRDKNSAPEDVFEANYSEVPACVPARYEVLSRVGTGGMGIVYKVRDLEAREVIALKILKPGASADQAMQENLRREVFLARKVTHKNVCRIHEFNRSKGTAYISMEFIEGESLLRRLRRGGAMPLEESLRIVRQICAGLREAHLQGIVHRDLKPANVMLDVAGNVKIMDFGIARLAQDTGQMTGTVAGTPAYMAPEQVQVKPVGPRTDIYSTGLLLYEMVTGAQAFTGDNSIAIALKQINESPRRPRDIEPTIPTRIEDVILKCLEKDPARRFQSVDEFEAALVGTAPIPRSNSLAGSLGPEFRRTANEISQAVTRGFDAARPAGPAVAKFARQAQQNARRAGAIAGLQVRKSAAHLSSSAGKTTPINWSFVTKSRYGQVITATLVAGFLLAGVVAFGHGARSASAKNSDQPVPVTVSTVVPASPAPLSSSPAPTDKSATDSASTNSPTVQLTSASGNVGTSQVDLSSGFGLAPTTAPLPSAAVPDDETVDNAKFESEPITKSAPSVTKSVKKSATNPASSKHPSSNAVAKSTSAKPLPTAAPAQPATPTANSATTTGTVPSTSSTSEVVAKPSDPVAAPAPLWEPYLDAGSFKDQPHADEVVTKLTHAGFHAFSVQKNRLFMGSFHVEVGPFATQKEIEAAQQQLSTLGFKSHSVK